MTLGPNLAAALVAAMAEIKNPQFDKINTGVGRGFQYASLGALLGAVKPVLAKHGLGIVQAFRDYGDGSGCVETTLVHETGESMSTVSPPFALDPNPQKTGAWVTYYRRYMLSGMLGVLGDEDDDAESVAAPIREATAEARPAGGTSPSPAGGTRSTGGKTAPAPTKGRSELIDPGPGSEEGKFDGKIVKVWPPNDNGGFNFEVEGKAGRAKFGAYDARVQAKVHELNDKPVQVKWARSKNGKYIKAVGVIQIGVHVEPVTDEESEIPF